MEARRTSFVKTALSIFWSIVILMIGWPSLRLSGGELWWSATVGLVAVAALPWIIVLIGIWIQKLKKSRRGASKK